LEFEMSDLWYQFEFEMSGFAVPFS
jgi:hypothetical protein